MNPEASPNGGGQFEQMSHDDLVGAFFEVEGADHEMGRELSLRLLDHAGLPRDLGQMPLIDNDGNLVQMNATVVTVSDYVNYAAVHHLHAIPGILDFLTTTPGSSEYDAGQTVLTERLKAGR